MLPFILLVCLVCLSAVYCCWLLYFYIIDCKSCAVERDWFRRPVVYVTEAGELVLTCATFFAVGRGRRAAVCFGGVAASVC